MTDDAVCSDDAIRAWAEGDLDGPHAPMTWESNHAIAGAHFERRFGRRPLPPGDADATINDLIFATMIEPSWTPLQRAFVDKETATHEAQALCPSLRVAETLQIIPIEAVPSPAHLHRALLPHIGKDAIAKPTHASGAATMLRDIQRPEQLASLHWLASRDYAGVLREMQYWQLPRKIIVERLIPAAGGGAPDDYKFHCIWGKPLLCQVDHDRGGRPWSRLLRLPDLAAFDPDDGLVPPPTWRPPNAERRHEMIAAATALSAPFEFVRVDLYDGLDGVTFGELTFSPAASLGIAPSARGDHAVNPTHIAYSRLMMAEYRRTA